MRKTMIYLINFVSELLYGGNLIDLICSGSEYHHYYFKFELFCYIIYISINAFSVYAYIFVNLCSKTYMILKCIHIFHHKC